MTKSTTMVTNNLFRPTRFFREGSNNITWNIEVLYDQSHHNGGKWEQTKTHSNP